MVEIAEDSELVHIRFAGGMTDVDSIPLEDLIHSLEGFQEFFGLADNMFIQQRLTLRSPPPDRRIQIRVKRIGPESSIEAILQFVGFSMLAGLIEAGTVAGTVVIVRKLWKWRRSLIEARVRKRSLWNMEEAVGALESLARDAGLQSPDDESDDPEKIVQHLDHSLREAVSPIDRSVERISVQSTTTNTRFEFARAERVSLNTEPVEGYEALDSSDWEKREVILLRIYPHRRSGLMTFVKAAGPEERGVKSCTIVDPRVRRVCDPYTKALHERRSLNVWARRAVLNAVSASYRWEITLAPPTSDSDLFDYTTVTSPRK